MNPVRPQPILTQSAEEIGREGSKDENENEQMQEGGLQQEGGEAQVPKCVRDPGEPTLQEKKDHEKTHMPYRSWCRHCVMGRGRDLPHETKDRSEDGIPIIALDFYFIGEPGIESLMPAAAMRDSIYKALFANGIPGRGLDYEWTSQQMVADIGRLGLATPRW